MTTRLTSKALVAIGAVASAAILGLLAALVITQRTLGEARTWERSVITATRDAVGNPRLKRDDVPEQIAALGRSFAAVRNGLNNCNASARAAAEQDRQRQAEAERRFREAEARARSASSAAEAFDRSAERQRVQEQQCDPSPVVLERWSQ
jgi:hypothetical protein